MAQQDIYTARTADGVDLAMRRYRPDPESPLRESAQPVILMPGMACNFNFFDVHTPEGAAYDAWCPPKPSAGDGYYYYSDNLGRISLPALVLVDATRDITDPEDVQAVYELKARNPKDRCYVIPGTAHADIVLGLNAPTELYPRIGDWLESL